MRRDSVAGTGGGDGKSWFDAANWTGGAIPDLANVASVWLPTSVRVTFQGTDTAFIDRLTGTPDADRVSSATDAALEMLQGRLVVANQLSIDTLVQRGGELSGAGSIGIADGLMQTGGSIAMAGDVTVRQGAGDMVIRNLSGRDIALYGQQGVQAGTLVTQRDLTIVTGGDAVLTGPTSVGRNMSVTAGTSGVGSISQSGPIQAGGYATFTAAGDIALTGQGNRFDGSLSCASQGGALSGSCAVVERRRSDDRLTRFAATTSASGGSPGDVREAMSKVVRVDAIEQRMPIVTLAEVVGDMSLNDRRDTTYITAMFGGSEGDVAYKQLNPKINLGSSVYYVGN